MSIMLCEEQTTESESVSELLVFGHEVQSFGNRWMVTKLVLSYLMEHLDRVSHSAIHFVRLQQLA